MTARYVIAAVPLLVAGALLTPHAATAAPTASTATPQALSLTLRDVQHAYGSTFRPFLAHTYKASHKSACGADYTGGYLTMFGNFGKASATGAVVSVESVIFAYASSRSAACASKAHGTSLATVMGKSAAGTKVHASPLTGVGDSAYLFTVSSTKNRSYSIMIWLSRGTHIAMVTVSAVGRSPAQPTVIALAKVIDGRLQAAG
mgnify:CR=1 FL=1